MQPGSSVADPAASTVPAAPSSSARVTGRSRRRLDAPVAGPGEVCPAGEMPAVFAYDLDTGVDEWATCSLGETQRFLLAATDDVAYLVEHVVSEQGPPGEPPALVALDAHDGSERWRMPLASTWWGIPPGSFLGAGSSSPRWTTDRPAIAGIDAASGTVVWRIDANERSYPVAVTERVVVVRMTRSWTLARTPMVTDASGQLVRPTFTYQLDGYDRATGVRCGARRSNARPTKKA